MASIALRPRARGAVAAAAAAALLLQLLAAAAAAAPGKTPRVAIIGGGVAGTSAAFFLRQAQPSWELELFERERVGGRTQEFFLDGETLELGASIIHSSNQYVLGLAAALNLTAQPAGDSGAAGFAVYDGARFVLRQAGGGIRDVLAVLRRYGVAPLRYKWLSQQMGRRFSGIYALQAQGRAFATPGALWQALGLYELTQTSASAFMEERLGKGLWGYGAARFAEELAGAVNRVNYNQPTPQLNALAGLVSYLPAAEPSVLSIREGNAALPRRLAAAARLGALRVGAEVTAVRLGAGGAYTLDVVQRSERGGDGGGSAGSGPAAQGPAPLERFGPYDAVVLAAPLHGSGIELDPAPAAPLPPRQYQPTVTTFVSGRLNPSYFKDSLPEGDVLVSSSAATPFSVVAVKGPAGAAAAAAAALGGQGRCGSSAAAGGRPRAPPGSGKQQASEQRQRRGPEEPGEGPVLYKVFSERPLEPPLLQQLFLNGSEVLVSKRWMAYPRFHPPEQFAPFLLGPGLCYANGLEGGASAMEVAAVAAKNCALLVEQELSARAGGAGSTGGGDGAAGVAAS